MSCKPDLGTIISEIEWLVKNHSRCILDSHERLKPCTKRITNCGDERYSMNITLDIFVKLHQMLHNYIGLLNFRGPKSRDFESSKIPLNEALDVAVRAMISAMQSSAPKQPFSTPVCLNCSRSSKSSRRQSINSRSKCDLDKLSEIEEVDKKLLRLKAMTLESAENVEVYIKDALHAITKLPLSAMTSRLEILSSVVRNTKNKLTSCGRPSPASLMRTQVNPISQIVSEFIQEYGQMKSKIYPCQKICRFCGSFICPMDRQRNIFCCENSKHLNFLWKEWIRQNSLKGVAKWDEDTIMSIVDSFRDNPVEEDQCVSSGPCTTFCKTAGQRSSRSGVRDGKVSGGSEKGRRQGGPNEHGEWGSKFSTHSSRRESQSVENSPGDQKLRNGGGHSKISRIGSGEKRDSQDPDKGDLFGSGQKRVKDEGRGTNSHNFNVRNGGERQGVSKTSDSGKTNSEKGSKYGRGTSQKRDKDEGRGTNSHNSNVQSGGEHRSVGKTSDSEKTSRQKRFKKDAAGGVNVNDQDDSPGIDRRKKGTRSGKGDPLKMEDDLHAENKRGGKSSRKKEGELLGHSLNGDRRIGNTVEPSGVESSKKGRELKNAKKVDRDSRKTAGAISPERGNRNGTIEPVRGSKREPRIGNNEVDGISSGMKTRGKYGETDGKRSSSREGGLEVKSGNGRHGQPREMNNTANDDPQTRLRPSKPDSLASRDGENIIEYRLSNKLFIKLGWTLLPKDTVMRRVVEFQASTAKPHMNWLKNNRIHGKQYYTDGKTVFMNFLEDGSGQVNYPNGQTAISAQISKKGPHELYKVYAMGGRDVMGVVRLPWLMGVFDSLGNGVVYDENCNIRVTYNQHGGVYVDNPAKVPFSWGWNNFQTFPVDEAVYEDPPFDRILPELMPARKAKDGGSKASKQSKSSRVLSSEKLSEDQAVSESEKSTPFEPVKVIPCKVLTPLKPICLKMNKYLSLRILDRKNINLQFFAGPKCVRIELGTEVDPNVQINSELVERDDWLAKMTKLHTDVNKIELNPLSPDSSLLEIAKEFRRAKNEANSRKLMIAKYRPQLISPSFQHDQNHSKLGKMNIADKFS